MNDREKLELLQSAVIDTLLERVTEEEEEIVYDADGVGTPTGKRIKKVDSLTLSQAMAMLKQNQVVASVQSIGTLDKLKAKLKGSRAKALPKVEDG